jgi:hypothetical protein
VNNLKFEAEVKAIMTGLQQDEATAFEVAQEHLGKLLGYDAGRSTEQGAPDPWWRAEDLCLVFEDYTETKPNQPYPISKTKQAGRPSGLDSDQPQPGQRSGDRRRGRRSLPDD